MGQNLCYTWSIIGKEGTYEENYLYHLAFTITLLCGCGSKSGGDDAQDGGNTQQEEFVITPMASGLELESYSCADFSMSVPEGWMVEAATSNAGMYHALRAYDPACMVNQICIS